MSIENLPCHGCAHSAADAPPPGIPSGERPCCFCIRNPDREKWRDDALRAIANGAPTDVPGDLGSKSPFRGCWYDGSPAFKVPMDCYIATDRLQQQQRWAGGGVVIT